MYGLKQVVWNVAAHAYNFIPVGYIHSAFANTASTLYSASAPASQKPGFDITLNPLSLYLI